MTNDDIVRKFLDLHPDTPIDEKQYAVPLQLIKHMLKFSALAEREACAKVAENGNFLHDDSPEARFGKSCAAAIRRRGQE